MKNPSTSSSRCPRTTSAGSESFHSDSIQPIATTKSGDIFILYGPDQRVICVTSEGQAGVVARDLREFLTVIVMYPYWFDLLKFSEGGKLEEMQSAVEPLELQEAKYKPRLQWHRLLLMEQLGLRSDPTAISGLHHAVGESGRDLRILGADGSEYESLFSRFEAAHLRRSRLGESKESQN